MLMININGNLNFKQLKQAKTIMELKLNSWYVWLWDYTYSETVPNNLCPLFWKLAVAILLFIPNVIFRIPTNIFNACQKHDWNLIDVARTGFGIIFYIATFGACWILYFEYNYILWLFDAYSYDSLYATFGGIFLCIGIFLIIRYFWLEYNTGYKIENVADTIKEKASNNIIINYTKAWYNNHCPKITWK